MSSTGKNLAVHNTTARSPSYFQAFSYTMHQHRVLKWLLLLGIPDVGDDIIPVIGQLDDWYFPVLAFVILRCAFLTIRYRDQLTHPTP